MDQSAKIKLTQKIIYLTGVFCFVVSLLLLLNYWQVRTNEPLENEALKLLVERLSEDPRNEQLKNEIRNLDLLARKAHFTSWWQIKTGSYLLLFGVIVFAVALRLYHAFQSKIELPKESLEEDKSSSRIFQKWMWGLGTLIFILAFGSSYLNKDFLQQYEVEGTGMAVVPEEKPETIEVIQIKSSSEEKSPVTGDEVGPKKPVAAMAEEDKTKEALAVAEKPLAIPQKKEKVKPASAETALKFPDYNELKKHHNGFRGVLGNGVSHHFKSPVDWDGAEGKNVIWKVEIPKPGYNSPVIWKEKLFLAGADDQERMVYCYNRHTGALLWKGEASNVSGSPDSPPEVTDDTGLSAPTVAVDGQRVFAIFGTGDLIAFDLNGVRLWAKNLGVPDNHYGHSSSLIVWEDKLFVQYDSNNGGRLVAFNTSNGSIVWDVKRDVNISWASPVLMKSNDQYQLITSSDPNVAAYDLNTGKELWAIECMMGEVGPSPAFGEGLVFAANEYAKLVAIKPGPTPEIVWENNEYLPEVSSPVVSKGLLFVATSYGVLVCYDAKTGEKYWEKEFSQGFYASPMVADGKLYALDMDGVMHIFKVDKDAKLMGEPKLGEKAVSTPAFADERIYLRGEKHLFCIGDK